MPVISNDKTPRPEYHSWAWVEKTSGMARPAAYYEPRISVGRQEQ